MGQVAEDMMDGTVCSACGQFFQDAENDDACYTHGYPVACKSCFRAGMRNRGIQKAIAKTICLFLLALMLSGCSRTIGRHENGVTMIDRWQLFMSASLGSASYDARDGSFTLDGYKSDMTQALDLIKLLTSRDAEDRALAKGVGK